MKYTDIESNPENDIAWVLQNVTNELAEANRLKILELTMNPKYTQSWIDDHGKLEDGV